MEKEHPLAPVLSLFTLSSSFRSQMEHIHLQQGDRCPRTGQSCNQKLADGHSGTAAPALLLCNFLLFCKRRKAPVFCW